MPALLIAAVFGVAGWLARDYRRYQAGLPTISNRAIGTAVLIVLGVLVVAFVVVTVQLGHVPFPVPEYVD